jgi:hypothetical protein
MRNEPNSPSAGPALAGRLCKTKPNLGELGHVDKGGHRTWATSPESGMRKTNPIARSGAPRRCPADGIPHHSNILLFQHSSPAPIVQNEPNPAGRPGPRRRKCAKRTQFGLAWAAQGPGRTEDVKRSQFAASPAWCQRADCAKQTQLHRRTMSGGTPNPPRAEGQPCKTNPISGGRDTPTIPIFHYSSVPIRCQLCETNPIPGRAGWDGAWGTKGGGSRAKQSQFPSRTRNDTCFGIKELWRFRPLTGLGETKPISAFAARQDAYFCFIDPAASGTVCGSAATATRVFLHSWLELTDYEK